MARILVHSSRHDAHAFVNRWLKTVDQAIPSDSTRGAAMITPLRAPIVFVLALLSLAAFRLPEVSGGWQFRQISAKRLVFDQAVAGGQVIDAAQQRANALTVLANVRIIDGTGAPARANQTLVIENGTIKDLGEASRISIPSGARVLDLPGRTVMPGLVMLHEHLTYSGGDELFRIQPFSAPRLFLAFGVTTIRTAGIAEPYAELNLKRRIDAGLVPGPEMFVTGPWFNEPEEGPGLARFLGMKYVRDVDDARRAVRYWAAEGVTSIKVYRRTTPRIMKAIIEEAHSLRLQVMGHLGATTCREAAALGMDFIEHGFSCPTDLRQPNGEITNDPESSQARELIQALVARGVTVDSTPVSEGPLTEAELEVLHPGARERYVPRRGAERVLDDPAQGKPSLYVAFVRAGGRLVVGSDPGGNNRIPGFSNHKSLRLLYELGGFSALEAIRIATLNGATALGIQNRTGAIAIGKEADLIVVRGDPSVTIRDSSNVEMVFSNGTMFEPGALLAEVKGKFGWQ
jgi:imidazolonepropionase-like amidohydrolase